MINRNQLNINENACLFNIRLVRTHIDYINKNYPSINTDDLLNYAGITRLQYNDFGYWCNQSQINKFHEILVEKTGNREITRDTGRHLMISQNIIAQYILGFKNPTSAALQIAHIYSKLSRGASTWGKILSEKKVELFAKPNPGVQEKQFQCNYRIGCLEGICQFFTCENLIVHHPECIHQGAKRCRYIVSWGKISDAFKWLRIRNHLIFIGFLSSVLSYFLLPFHYFSFIALFSIFASFVLTFKVQTLEKEKLSKNVDELGRTAEQLLDELNLRYNVTKLVQEVGEITSVVQTEKEIASAVSKAMNQHLDYDRGAILLAGKNKKNLHFAGGDGFTETETALAKELSFSLHNQLNESSPLQNVFEKQEPSLIVDIDKIISSMNSEYVEVVKDLNVKSVICVPILHEGESLGIMLVDSSNSQQELSEGNINLLMAVAAQTALSIVHAKAFQQLQESEKKHRTLVETIRDIVYTIDLEGRFSYISPIAERVTGFSPHELIGKHFIEILSPGCRNMVIDSFNSNLKNKSPKTLEVQIVAKNGVEIPMELNTTTLYDVHGATIGRIGVARDITSRYVEEARRKEMEVKALTQDKLASLGEIATGIAHEINQPLTYIKIILQSALNDFSKEELDTEELTGDFEESLRQVSKISDIISHLRTFGRTDVTLFGPVSLSTVLHDTLILMRERLRIRNILIDIYISDTFPMLNGNHIKLEQVFLNLIQNSIDAMEEQGKGEIKLIAKSNKGRAMITFSDTGKGIPPNLQERVFEPFFTMKEAGKGTGIGLSIVYGIIQEHQGEIICESEVGKGANFKIELPFYKDEKGDFISEPLNT